MTYEPEDNPYDEPGFQAGLHVGIAIGKGNTYDDVKLAHSLGLIEEWLESQRPKEWDEWTAYYEAHPRGSWPWDKDEAEE